VASFLCSRVPASNRVCATLAPMVQTPEAGRNRVPRPPELPPKSPVMVICGSWLAMAAPISALAAWSCASAARTSGRCSTSWEGRLSGNSSGKCSVARSKVSPRSWFGNRRSGSSTGCAAARAASAAAARWPASGSAPLPASARPRGRLRRDRTGGGRRPSELVSIWMMPSVAAIWARKDARLTAAVTTFDVKVRYVASSWSADSRPVPPGIRPGGARRRRCRGHRRC